MESDSHKQTIRQQIIELLGTDRFTARDLSQAVSITEKEVMAHLQHIERSVRYQGKKLVEAPHQCLSCGFVFDRRNRFSRPGRCPKCRNSHIRTAIYWLE